MFRISRRILAGQAAILLYIFLALVYYYLFVVSRNLYSDSILQLATNQHDHDVYLFNMDLVKDGSSLFEFANDKGIASIYLFLSKALPFLVAPDMELISLVFNCSILVLNYWIYGKLADGLGLGLFGRLSFFFNLSLLYFAQLINKDMLTIAIFLTAAYAGMHGRHWLLLLLIPFAAYIRIQLVVFILIFTFLSSTKGLRLRFVIVYILTSLLAAYLSVYFSIIGEDSLGDGFSAYLIDLNNKYLIGYLIFNPVRLLQYIYDAYLSFNIFSENGAIDVAKILRIPQLALLAMLTIYFFKLIKHWNIYSKTVAKPLVVSILAYACTWLMNPTVNARYVMLITPILVLLGLYVRSTYQRRAHSHV
jgi:hypothetical protein